MAETEPISVEIDDVVVRLVTDYEPLRDYVETLLSRVRVSNKPPDVRSRLRVVRKMPLQSVPPLGEFPEVAYGIRGRGDAVEIDYVPGFPGLQVQFAGRAPLEMTSRLIYQVPWDGLRSALGRYPRGYFPTRLMYHSIYVPAAWFLGSQMSRFWAHAGAVIRDQRAVVVGGLAGIGKSTLCLRLIQDTDFELLSDDLVFYDTERVYTCYEPVRQVAEEHSASGPAVHEGGRVMGDKHAREMPQQAVGAAKPVVLLLPRFGEETRLIELDSERAAHRLYTTSRLAAQVSEFDFYATTLSAYYRIDDWFPRQLRNLSSLLADVRCFELQMCRSDGPERAYEMVSEIVDETFE